MSGKFEPEGTWAFRPKAPGEAERNPVSGEFFATDAVRNVSDSLIREALQNSLDASSGDTTVRVAIHLANGTDSLGPDVTRPWFNALWRHIAVPRNELRQPPGRADTCPYLTIEDFGTTGLTGDAATGSPPEEGDFNRFFNFFRAEGESDKGGSARGSWGIGKAVFPRASRLNSFFGLTVRADGSPLLFGRSILRYHKLDGTDFSCDGYFGVRNHGNAVTTPSTRRADIDQFTSDFHLTRRGEPGLSLVVPYVAASGEDATSFQDLVRATIIGYYFAILKGKLAVTISDAERRAEIDETNLEALIEDGDDQSLRAEILPVIKLSRWALQCPKSNLYPLSLGASAPPEWTGAVLPDAGALGARLRSDENLGLAVDMPITSKNGQKKTGKFTLFLANEPEYASDPQFVRRDLVISGIRRHGVRGARALVLIDDPVLSRFLLDAENPAHTDWSIHSGNFKEKYRYGDPTIRFVKRAPRAVLDLLAEKRTEPNRKITASYFPKRRAQPDPNERRGPGVPPLPPREPPPFSVSQIQGGFRVTVPAPPAPPILVRVAYDIRQGNPFKRFDENDFMLPNLNLAIKPPGAADVQFPAANQLLLRGTGNVPFSVDLIGFDPNRDLKIAATLTDAADAD